MYLFLLILQPEDKPSDVHSPGTEHVQQMEICEYAIVKAVGDNAPAPLTPSSQARDDHSENLTLKRRYVGAMNRFICLLILLILCCVSLVCNLFHGNHEPKQEERH